MSEIANLKAKISDLELHIRQLQRDLMQSEKARADCFNELSRLKDERRNKDI